MKSFASNGTAFEASEEDHSLTIAVMMLPPWDRFPEGRGTIAAVCFMMPQAMNSTIRIGDDVALVRTSRNVAHLSSDGKVNILDLAILAMAFASHPGRFRWNTNADLDKNQTINIREASMIARNFGKTS